MAVPRLATGPVALVAATVAVVHLVLAAVPRAWFDEDLMLAIGRHHLDWGAVDQPPLTPLLARLADTIAPGSQFVLALPAVLAAAGAVLLTALMARELGGDSRAQTLAALGQGTCVAAAQFGHWLTPYSLEPALWAGIFWLLLRWLRLRDDRLLLALGVLAGLTAQTRFQVMALALVVVTAIVLTGPRALLGRPAFWAGTAIALAIAAPTLLWQAANGWPQLAMAEVVSAENSLIYGSPLLVAGHGLAVTGPLTLGLAVCGLVALYREPRWRELRFLGVTFAILFAIVVITSGRHYYLLSLYSVLVALGAVALQHRREAGRRRAAWPVVALSVVLAVAGLASSVVLASPKFADPLVAATARAYHDLPPWQRERTAIGANPYVYAAYLDAAAPELELPAAASPNRAYGWFPPPPDSQDHLLLAGEPDQLRPWFTHLRALTTVHATTPLGTYGGLVPEATTIWLLSGRNTPWTEIWPALRGLALEP
ncbi:glycosyltransferase family 39 protein [Amycolatopsis sp. 195334CR]|uniref:glycosyltransferase family 39 protein n=1 Tax=Amycolatopsis sp. 195334CR TaxID=2814588 RepID=UPI001A908435|nr:glycosyltransferase family 39 protein [Amycolatopsis sp. 195334CR]MBN6038194.1 glycosyltransferase family 39 protein [Amycolatopsis sp. 195334CR]